MSDPSHEHADPAVAFESAKLGVWTFLATEVLLFGALFTRTPSSGRSTRRCSTRSTKSSTGSSVR